MNNYRHNPEPTDETLVELSLDLAEFALSRDLPKIAHKLVEKAGYAPTLVDSAYLLLERPAALEVLKTCRANILSRYRRSENVDRKNQRVLEDLENMFRQVRTQPQEGD